MSNIDINDIIININNDYKDIIFDNDVSDTDESSNSEDDDDNSPKRQKTSHSSLNDNSNNSTEKSNPPSRHIQIRRERNRIHARHARERKKAHMDTLEQRIQTLIDQVLLLLLYIIIYLIYYYRKRNFKILKLKALLLIF